MSSKKEHFKDILSNIASQSIEYAEHFFIEDMIEMLSEAEAYVLGVLFTCTKESEFSKRIEQAKQKMSSSNSFFIDQNYNRMLEIITGWQIDNVYSAVESLQKKGLIQEYAEGGIIKGMALLNNSLTADGIAVCEAILS